MVGNLMQSETQCSSAIKLRHSLTTDNAEAVLAQVSSAAVQLRKTGKISPAAYERIKYKVSAAQAQDRAD